jgi:hypothetical protein
MDDQCCGRRAHHTRSSYATGNPRCAGSLHALTAWTTVDVATARADVVESGAIVAINRSIIGPAIFAFTNAEYQ